MALKCDICNCRLHLGRWYSPVQELFGWKLMTMVSIIDLDNSLSWTSLLCQEDKTWVINNQGAAEAIYKGRLYGK